jgi:hypothetical protein
LRSDHAASIREAQSSRTAAHAGCGAEAPKEPAAPSAAGVTRFKKHGYNDFASDPAPNVIHTPAGPLLQKCAKIKLGGRHEPWIVIASSHGFEKVPRVESRSGLSGATISA